MDFNDIVHAITILATPIASIAGAIFAVQHFTKNLRRERDKEAKKILEQAQEEIALAKSELEAKLTVVKLDVSNLEKSIEKDVVHIKETHNSEIAALSDKIEALREQLTNQHSQMISLLSKLIDNS